MEKEFNVGDTVWWASCGTKHRTQTCPVCFGDCRVVLILGNGEQVSTPCDFCGKGFDGPRGYIEEYEWIADVKQVTIDRKDVSEGENGREVEYRNSNYILRDGVLFSEKADAEACVADMIAQHEIDLARNLATRKEYNVKSYAWHVGYHQRELKRAERQVEYHSAKVVSMKKLTKEEKK